MPRPDKFPTTSDWLNYFDAAPEPIRNLWYELNVNQDTEADWLAAGHPMPAGEAWERMRAFDRIWPEWAEPSAAIPTPTPQYASSFQGERERAARELRMKVEGEE